MEIFPAGVWKKGVFKNFAKFTGKHQHQSLFFNKAADLMPDSHEYLVLKQNFPSMCHFLNEK